MTFMDAPLKARSAAPQTVASYLLRHARNSADWRQAVSESDAAKTLRGERL